MIWYQPSQNPKPKKEKKKSRNNSGKTKEIASRKRCGPHDILYLLETILSFHAWYKCGHPFPVSTEEQKEEVLDAIRGMLTELMTTLPRRAANGWKLQKLHELMHLAMNMLLFGSPQNWDTGPSENNLIT